MAARAEVATLAGERQQILMRTGVAADAREAVLEDTKRQEVVGRLRTDGTARAVLAGEALVVDCLSAGTALPIERRNRRTIGPAGNVVQ